MSKETTIADIFRAAWNNEPSIANDDVLHQWIIDKSDWIAADIMGLQGDCDDGMIVVDESNGAGITVAATETAEDEDGATWYWVPCAMLVRVEKH